MATYHLLQTKYCFTVYKIVLQMNLFSLKNNPSWPLVIVLVYERETPRQEFKDTPLHMHTHEHEVEWVDLNSVRNSVIFPSHTWSADPLIMMALRLCESRTRVSEVRVKPEPALMSLAVGRLDPLPCHGMVRLWACSFRTGQIWDPWESRWAQSFAWISFPHSISESCCKREGKTSQRA